MSGFLPRNNSCRSSYTVILNGSITKHPILVPPIVGSFIPQTLTVLECMGTYQSGNAVRYGSRVPCSNRCYD
ncbi:hypothetical protein OUZ56_010088 [Daphnia magna]|uniref:Uncharacterized protein n=1 Tax=Daphnia magna TaxID=35525 RepID=A0ABR0AHR7_9CRUS|nr:hypothetical protein OUZ56_010088 [Daphnia magna]